MTTRRVHESIRTSITSIQGAAATLNLAQNADTETKKPTQQKVRTDTPATMQHETERKQRRRLDLKKVLSPPIDSPPPLSLSHTHKRKSIDLLTCIASCVVHYTALPAPSNESSPASGEWGTRMHACISCRVSPPFRFKPKRGGGERKAPSPRHPAAYC